MNTFEIEILSPEGVVLKEQVVSASFPTASGVITVFAGHENLVSKLNFGEIMIKKSASSKEKKVSITGGFLEILRNHVNVVAEFAVPSDEVNKQKIERAKQTARELKNKRKDLLNISVVESQLKKVVSEFKSGISLKQKTGK
jgi:F-type H+-transporting ATPase subunit epsilon